MIKQKISIFLGLLVLFLLMVVFPQPILAQVCGNSIVEGGEQCDDGDVIKIRNCQELQNINCDPGADYVLENDIDCTGFDVGDGMGFEPIETFTGTLDGKGYKITGLFINRPIAGVGLFSSTSAAVEIKNVGLENAEIHGGTRVGGLVGVNRGSITSCYVNGTVTGSNAGLLVGMNTGAISNSYSAGYVAGTTYIGGLVGRSDVGPITNCFSSAGAAGTYKTGGLVGDNEGSTISDCYSTGDVNGRDSTGGLVGSNQAPITNSFSTGNVTADSAGDSNTGGLVGTNWSNIDNSFFTGTVSGNDYVGGLVGHNWPAVNINNSYSTGAVSGFSYVGGLVGWNSGGAINNSFSTGAVSSVHSPGGLVGDNTGSCGDSFWDTQTSGQPTSACGTGKTTVEMQQQATFDPPWDFISIWAINESVDYPYFQFQLNSPVISFCGNDVCEAGEDSSNCPGDCGGGSLSTCALGLSCVGCQCINLCGASPPPPPCQNHNVYGWAYSENIGWMSFSCRNTVAEGTGIDYGVDIDPVTGMFSGYAWSENIGWISFEPADLVSCPIAPCQAELDLSTGEVSGWARALAAADGWDGWIKLRGWTNEAVPQEYGVSLNSAPTPSEFEGWAWGDDVIGWISFNCSNTAGACGISDYKVMTDIIVVMDSSPYIEPGSTNIQYEEYCNFSPTGRIAFEWTYQDDEGDQQSQYNLQIATDLGFSNLVVDAVVNQSVSPGSNGSTAVSVVQSPTAQIDDLDIAYGDSYFWRASVKAATGNLSWSNWESGSSFSTPSNPYPNPSFDWYPESPPAEVEVTFTDNSFCYTGFDNCKDDADTSYEWDFDNDSVIDDITKGDTVYTYLVTGDYSVKLGVTDIIDGIQRTCYQEEPLTATLPLPTWKEIVPF